MTMPTTKPIAAPNANTKPNRLRAVPVGRLACDEIVLGHDEHVLGQEGAQADRVPPRDRRRRPPGSARDRSGCGAGPERCAGNWCHSSPGSLRCRTRWPMETVPPTCIVRLLISVEIDRPARKCSAIGRTRAGTPRRRARRPAGGSVPGPRQPQGRRVRRRGDRGRPCRCCGSRSRRVLPGSLVDVYGAHRAHAVDGQRLIQATTRERLRAYDELTFAAEDRHVVLELFMPTHRALEQRGRGTRAASR